MSRRSGSHDADVIQLVTDACGRHTDVPALIFEDGLSLSRAGLIERVEAFLGYLWPRVQPGERVAIMLANRAEFMIAWLALVARGATLVAINTAAQSSDAGHALSDSEAVMAIVDPERSALLGRLVTNHPSIREVVVVADPEPDGLARYRGKVDVSLSDLEVDPQQVTNVYYTSGSTGMPKGCMVDHAYWLRFVDLYLEIYGLQENDRLLTCLQFFYNDPTWHLLCALRAGTSFVAMRRFSVSRFWDVVRRHRITQLFGIASIPSLLMSADPKPSDRDNEVRFAVQVGIPSRELHASLVERWGFPWLELYGLTETGIVAAMPPSRGASMLGSGSVGRPAPGAEVRLIDEAGADVATGETGELAVRAPGMMRGYLGQPDAGPQRGGWFPTGDLLRADDEGFLYFVGRAKDVIRRAGENVAAAEVEAVLREYPGVVEVAAVAVADELRGEEIMVHVLLAEGASAPPWELISHCATRLAKHKVPRFVAYREDDFPRTPSMRVAKRVLAEAEPDAHIGAWDREAPGAYS